MSRIVIKNVRLSYANIWEPKQMKGDTSGKMRYSASLLISKDDTKTIKAVNKAIEEAKDLVVGTGTITMDAQHNPIKQAVILENKDGDRVVVAKIMPSM